jgi:hypothetical protein
MKPPSQLVEEAMTPIIYDCEQGTDEWKRLRLGLATASEFSSILAKGAGKTRKTYLLKLAGERITEEPAESYSNGYLERGKVMETEARDCYALMHDTEIRRVGFIRSGNTGCSPDGLIGEKGMIEIKTQAPHLLIERIFSGDIPSEHIAQLQGSLWIAKREWIDLVVYYHRMPMFERRIVRDEPYIKSLAMAVRQFNEELDELVAKIRAMQ